MTISFAVELKPRRNSHNTNLCYEVCYGASRVDEVIGQA